ADRRRAVQQELRGVALRLSTNLSAQSRRLWRRDRVLPLHDDRGVLGTAVPGAAREATPMSRRIIWGRWSFTSAGLTAFALAAGVCWFFPIYWAVITTLKHEYDTVKPGFQPIPLDPTLEAYSFVVDHTKIAYWYLNSIVTSIAVTVLVVAMS